MWLACFRSIHISIMYLPLMKSIISDKLSDKLMEAQNLIA